ncbi:hypothetical protein CABS01_00368 [Colletotrichum abscissum]|uniref:Uncharacterized protein n=1 Tax=Colletotrichum abscissum TaxID=1671311 RepID=A0A9P9XSP8_9PEZI|nr:uncharacterized protein CABS01_00368 [Colletotrichum abscissum]KAI3559299.1 hypothetical protein CABS02_00274 [Colletotrichum abscissum]KAK1525279.1 hypothetical protein CABS01_00368 [Colletotrichum abscissum]
MTLPCGEDKRQSEPAPANLAKLSLQEAQVRSIERGAGFSKGLPPYEWLPIASGGCQGRKSSERRLKTRLSATTLPRSIRKPAVVNVNPSDCIWCFLRGSEEQSESRK